MNHPPVSTGKRITLLTVVLVIVLLVVGGSSLAGQAQAQQPTISAEEAVAIATMQEVGRDDFRISDAGDEERYPAFSPSVAFNPDDNEYVVVWSGADGAGDQVANEFEIYAQRVDAHTGQEIGPNDVRISTMGLEGYAIFGAYHPAVVYNTDQKQYLVVWSGSDNRDELAQGELEIFGRLLSRAGTPLGVDDIRITNLGTDGSGEEHAVTPDVIYNPIDKRYLVVFSGSQSTKSNIYGQFVEADGSNVGATEFLISNIGVESGKRRLASSPALAHSLQTNEYLVTWSDATAGADQEFEIYGQLLTATGAPRNPEDLRISDMGPDGDAAYEAVNPDVVYNATDKRFLVVWEGNDEGAKVEIYGQFLEADGQASGADDFRISRTGPDGDDEFGAFSPQVSHDPGKNQYLVVWNGSSVVAEDSEIFGALLDAAGATTGPGPVRISQFGPDDDGNFRAYAPALAFDTVSNRYFVTWYGNDDSPGLGPLEYEVFGQLLDDGGVEIGEDAVLLSDMGHDSTHAVFVPQVAYNSQDHEYLVVWYADSGNSKQGEEWEIFGQRVDAITGREVGPNDFQISEIGPDGDENYDAGYPDVAYNSARNEYLVVWQADNNVNGQVEGEQEIYGRTVDAAGTPAPTQLRISYMGPDGYDRYDASRPSVAYNPIDDRYLVTWMGNDYQAQPGEDPATAPVEKEIYGRVLPGVISLTFPMVRISHMGPDGDTSYLAVRPHATHNGDLNQYLVVWYANDSADGLNPSEEEVYGQLLDRDGKTLAGSHFRISEAGPDGGYLIYAGMPDVAYNPVSNEYLVVWRANDANAGLPLGKSEIFGQLLDAYGNQIGTNDFRISTTGAMDSGDEYATYPAVTYESLNNQYVVTWTVRQRYGDAFPVESEIEAQLLTSDGTQVLANALRLSHMGPDGNSNYSSFEPALSCAAQGPSCLIVWTGNDDAGTLTNDEREVFGQLLGESTAPVAQPDAFSTPQDTPLTVPAPGVLANDVAEGKDLIALLDDVPANGDLTLEESGAFTYTPQPNFVGADSFSYYATDGSAQSDSVTVTIEVTTGEPDTGPAPGSKMLYLPFFGR